jgi:hypothetical protein
MTVSEKKFLAIMQEIRDWIRVAAYPSVRALLDEASPDVKSRVAYQMSDDKNTIDVIRAAYNIGLNIIIAVQSRCCAVSLMHQPKDKKRFWLNF